MSPMAIRRSDPGRATVAGTTTKPSRKRTSNNDDASDAESSSISTVHEAGACCLCHCSLDYSDLAAFDAAARQEDYSDDEEDDDASEYVFRKTDPFLPKDPLYQPHNALVYCDSCHRWYHQNCHFVPIFVIPSGAFTCLICQYEEKQQQPKARKKLVTKKHTNGSTTVSYPLQRMFQSPPVSAMAQYEKAWECDPVVIALKVSGWQDQLHHRLERKIHSALQKYRRSQRTLETLLLQSSKRTRQWHLGTASRRLSQELVQCLVASTSAQVTLRHTMLGLEWVRQLAGPRAAWVALHAWIAQYHSKEKEDDDDFVARILFPFGTQHPRRWHPVTPEYTDPPAPGPLVPEEVHIPTATSRGTTTTVPRATRTRSGRTTVPTTKAKSKKENKKKTTKASAAANTKVKATHTANDDDSGISLDELQCCICLSGDCTDENDLLLCDGAHCHRAYHMACLPGPLDAEQYEALDDWFCPLCQTQAECLYQIQRHVQRMRHDDDDDWERRRWSQAEADADSLQSWDKVQDVFPEADEEYELAQKLRRSRGVCNEEVKEKDIHRLLAPILGADVMGVEHLQNPDPIHDSEEEEEDDNFDPQQRLADDDDSAGSQASLADMSSVELQVPAEEVKALSKERLLLSPPQSRRRVSLRLTRRDSNAYDPGQMDLANILNGKRPRRRIDYRQLNDALFGQLSERELEEWDA